MTAKLTTFEFVDIQQLFPQVDSLAALLEAPFQNRFMQIEPESFYSAPHIDFALEPEDLYGLELHKEYREGDLLLASIRDVLVCQPGYLLFIEKRIALGNSYRDREQLEMDPELAKLFYGRMPIKSEERSDQIELIFKFIHQYEPSEVISQPVIFIAQVGSDNYYHWMYEIFARLWCLKRFPELRRFPIVYPVGQHPFIKETFELAGLSDCALVPMAPTTIHFKQLIFPSMLCARGTSSRVVPFLRETFAHCMHTPEPAKRRRIYISRSDAKWRRTVNEDQVIAMLKTYDFEPIVMTGLKVSEQIRLFSEASCVVASHGAALTNLVFCAPGSTIIELSAPTIPTNLFHLTSKMANLRYGRVWCKDAGGEKDIEVDIAHLKKTVEAALK